MVTLQADVVIQQPTRKVYEFLSDLDNIPKWETGVSGVKVLTDGPIRPGTRFEELIKIMGRQITGYCEVVEVEPGRKVAWRGIAPSFMTYSGSFTVADERGQSRLQYNGSVKLARLWRLLTPLFAADFGKEIGREMEKIKSLLED